MAKNGLGVKDSASRGKRIRSIISTHPDITVRETLLAEERMLQKYVKRCEFEYTNDKTIMMKKMADFVATGMAAYERDLKTRRLKLRKMIQTEQAEWMRDTNKWLREASMNKTKEKRMVAGIIHGQNEETRRTTIIPLQQYFKICPEVGSKSSREMARDVKRANLEQILEKDMRIQEEKGSDRMWHGIMSREVEAQQRLDKVEKRKQLERNIKTSSLLLEPVAGYSTYGRELCKLCD